MISAADIRTIEALMASLRVWILELALALLGPLETRRRPLGRRIARFIRTSLSNAEYNAKRALFMLAVARMNLPQPTKQHFIPALGYALKRRKCSVLRRVTHGFFNQRQVDIRTRIINLRDMLEHSEAWIARLINHLNRPRDCTHRILAAPPTPRTYAFAAPALSPADSS